LKHAMPCRGGKSSGSGVEKGMEWGSGSG